MNNDVAKEKKRFWRELKRTYDLLWLAALRGINHYLSRLNNLLEKIATRKMLVILLNILINFLKGELVSLKKDLPRVTLIRPCHPVQHPAPGTIDRHARCQHSYGYCLVLNPHCYCKHPMYCVYQSPPHPGGVPFLARRP